MFLLEIQMLIGKFKTKEYCPANSYVYFGPINYQNLYQKACRAILKSILFKPCLDNNVSN